VHRSFNRISQGRRCAPISDTWFIVAKPSGTLFLPTSTTLLTPAHSENDSRVYFMIVLTTDYCWRSWTCRIAAPYKFHADLFIDSMGTHESAPPKQHLDRFSHFCTVHLYVQHAGQFPDSLCYSCMHYQEYSQQFNNQQIPKTSDTIWPAIVY